MKVVQYFTGRGVLGVVFFVFGAPVSGAAYYFWVTSYSFPSFSLSCLIAAAASFAQLCSIPMMLIGREYSVSGRLPPE